MIKPYPNPDQFFLDILTPPEKEKSTSVIHYMNTALALEIITLLYSTKKVGYPWDIKRIWYQVFREPLPTENHHNISTEASISYDELRDRLFAAAIDYLAKKIDK